MQQRKWLAPHLRNHGLTILQVNGRMNALRHKSSKIFILLERFLSCVNVVPFSEAISLYAKERYRLNSIGMGIEDFDLLIGCTAVSKGLVMVTNNVRHYSRIERIEIDNWVK